MKEQLQVSGPEATATAKAVVEQAVFQQKQKEMLYGTSTPDSFQNSNRVRNESPKSFPFSGLEIIVAAFVGIAVLRRVIFRNKR